MKFEDTKLLDHPTVRKAYQVMRGFFSNGDDFAREAVRGGELISQHAKNPDPDPIAASVLQGGMIIPYRPEAFTKSVSPGTADILKKIDKLNFNKPVFSTEGERQFMLALNVVALEGLRGKIEKKDIFKYKDTQKMIDNNARALEAAAAGMADLSLAEMARDRLDIVRTVLEDLRRTTEEAVSFENSGLPDHPTVKKAYTLIRADEKKRDPLFTSYTKLGASIAKVLFEAGTTDPDLLGAALLNQYSSGETLSKEFSARLFQIYCDTSPFARDDLNKPVTVTPEKALISAATYVYLLDSTQQRYLDKKKERSGDFKGYLGPQLLEHIEDYTKTLESLAQNIADTKLKTRMEKSISSARSLMNAPANLKIRKPGSPRQDYNGW